MTPDELRSARLLFAAELAAGELSTEALNRPEVLAAVRKRPTAPPLRLAQALAVRHGLLRYERDVLARLAAARRAVLGERGQGPPRLLVRMDEFPAARAAEEPGHFGTDAFRRFDDAMRSEGVPYLVAVVPRPSRSYLDPRAGGDRPLTGEERSALDDSVAGGAEPALHGLTHRTRHARPRRHSELHGLDGPELAELLGRGMAELGAGIQPRVFVPPFNRFAASQYDELARRFRVVCGGPESVREVGFQATPSWSRGAVYLPCYRPLYGLADEIGQALPRVIESNPGTWVPVTLHLGWDGRQALTRLARAMAPYARPWSELLADADFAAAG